MFEQTRLIRLGNVFEIVHQIFFGDVEDLEFRVSPEVRSIDQKLETTPRRFHFLEVFMVQDLIHLAADLLVELGNHAVEESFVDALDLLAGIHHRMDKLVRLVFPPLVVRHDPVLA